MDPARPEGRDHLQRLRRGPAILRELRLRKLRDLGITEARAQSSRERTRPT